MRCNFVRIHQFLRVHPGDGGRVSDNTWSLEVLVEAAEPAPKKRGPSKKRPAQLAISS